MIRISDWWVHRALTVLACFISVVSPRVDAQQMSSYVESARAALARPVPANARGEELAKFHIVRADAARRLGDLEQQIAELRKARELSGGSFEATDLLASALHLNGEWDEARKMREELLAANISPPSRFVQAMTLASYYSQVGDFDRANSLMDRMKGGLLANSGNGGVWAHAFDQWTRSNVLSQQGRHVEAEPIARSATLRVAEYFQRFGAKVPDQRRYWRNLIDSNYAGILSRTGKQAEAEWMLREVLDRSTVETSADSVQTARVALMLADVQLRQGRVQRAAAQAYTSLDALRRNRVRSGSYVMSNALLLAGSAAVMAGDFEKANEIFDERQRALDADTDNRKMQSGTGNAIAGYSFIAQGEILGAVRHLEIGLDSERLRFGSQHPTVLIREAMLAYAYSRAGRVAEATTLFARAIPLILSDYRSRRAEDRQDAIYEAQIAWVLEGYIDSLVRSGAIATQDGIAEAFRIADIARGSRVHRAVALAASRAAIADPQLAELARQEQDLGGRTVALGAIIDSLLLRHSEQQPAQVIAAMRKDIERMTIERSKARSQISERFPRYAELLVPVDVSIEDVRRAMVSGEAMFTMYAARDRTYVWGIPKQGLVAFAVVEKGRAEIDAAARKLRKALDVGDVALSTFPEFDVGLSHATYQTLLAPVAAAWKGANTLITVPHGAMGEVPFAVLATGARAGIHTADFQRYRDVDWLIRDVAIYQLPSVSSLTTLRRTERRSAAPRAFAGFGDPVFAAASTGAGTVRRGIGLRNVGVASVGDPAKPETNAAIARLPGLPDTAQEIQEIAKMLGADVGDGRRGGGARPRRGAGKRVERPQGRPWPLSRPVVCDPWPCGRRPRRADAARAGALEPGRHGREGRGWPAHARRSPVAAAERGLGGAFRVQYRRGGWFGERGDFRPRSRVLLRGGAGAARLQLAGRNGQRAAPNDRDFPRVHDERREYSGRGTEEGDARSHRFRSGERRIGQDRVYLCASDVLGALRASGGWGALGRAGSSRDLIAGCRLFPRIDERPKAVEFGLSGTVGATSNVRPSHSPDRAGRHSDGRVDFGAGGRRREERERKGEVRRHQFEGQERQRRAEIEGHQLRGALEG